MYLSVPFDDQKFERLGIVDRFADLKNQVQIRTEHMKFLKPRIFVVLVERKKFRFELRRSGSSPEIARASVRRRTHRPQTRRPAP